MNIINHPKYDLFRSWYATGTYSNRLLEDCSQSELREALSYFVSNEEQNLTVNNIINSIVHNRQFSWSKKELDLFAEAILVNKLRTIGYDLQLVDTLPNNTEKLLKICSRLPLLTILKNKVYNTFDKFKKISIPWYFISVCLGLFVYFNLLLSIYSLIFTWSIWALTEIPKHDYIEHRYIKPKNTIIKYLLDFILYLLNPELYADRKSWQRMHDLHHKNWRSDKDTLTYAIDQGIILAMINHRPFVKPDSQNLKLLLTDYTKLQWLFKYLIEIKIVIAMVLFLLLGPQLFLYFVAIPAALKLGFEGQHDWYIIRFGERNYWFMWPLALNQAWHLQHHQTYNRAPTSWNDIFQGPKWVRYINPQYYIARSLFKINKPT